MASSDSTQPGAAASTANAVTEAEVTEQGIVVVCTLSTKPMITLE